MNDETIKQMMEVAARLAAAAESLDRVLERVDAQQDALNAKVDRIVAAVEEGVISRDSQQKMEVEGGAARAAELGPRVAELERSNGELRAQTSRMARKTLSPVVAALIAKNEIEGEKIDPAVLNKTLAALSVEQRIAVKTELARAGMIE